MVLYRPDKRYSFFPNVNSDTYMTVSKYGRRKLGYNIVPVLYPKADALTDKRPVKPVTQTAISLILRFRLCEECERAKLTEALLGLIEEYGTRMTTGFVGTPYLLHALSPVFDTVQICF